MRALLLELVAAGLGVTAAAQKVLFVEGLEGAEYAILNTGAYEREKTV